jgi:hypothetical protein
MSRVRDGSHDYVASGKIGITRANFRVRGVDSGDDAACPIERQGEDEL